MNRRQRGQALAEFAIVIPVFLLMVFGLIESARLVYVNNMLNNAAREGARIGSVQGSWIGQSGNGCNGVQGPVCTSAATYISHIVTAANGELIGIAPRADTDLTVTCGGAVPSASACTTGALVQVTVNYDYHPLIPVIGTLSIALSATASMASQ